jgi:hypothetical protein
MGKLPTDEIKLRELAQRLGVNTHGTVDPTSGKTNIPEIQSRIINAQRSTEKGSCGGLLLFQLLAPFSALAAATYSIHLANYREYTISEVGECIAT